MNGNGSPVLDTNIIIYLSMGEIDFELVTSKPRHEITITKIEIKKPGDNSPGFSF